ncbi:hypothetical protein ACEQ8H_001221 [Pleosporales sp. CAS-2024a]
MSLQNFPLFPLLPKEVRDTIWHHSLLPWCTTIHIQEGADLDVTHVSPPPGQEVATKEARAAYLAAHYQKHSIYTIHDWADVHVNQDSTLQIVILPPTASDNGKANLNVSWTELQTVLHDALPVVKRLHFVCSKPERLVRLWVGAEEGLVCPGKSHWDENLFGTHGLASDRACKEALRSDILVTSSVATLEEIAAGSQETVETRVLVEERVLRGFGEEREFASTKTFVMEGEERSREVEEWEEMAVPGGQGEGEALTEKALERFLQETGWMPKNQTPSSEYSVEVEYDGELWLTVS